MVATGTTFVLAWMSWQLIEQPILRLKKRFPYGERSSPAAVATTSEGA